MVCWSSAANAGCNGRLHLVLILILSVLKFNKVLFGSLPNQFYVMAFYKLVFKIFNFVTSRAFIRVCHAESIEFALGVNVAMCYSQNCVLMSPAS